MRTNPNVAAPRRELFPPWPRAQHKAERLARQPPIASHALRTVGFLPPDLAQRITDWFTGKPAASAGAVHQAYAALERDTARLFAIIRRAPALGGLGVRVRPAGTARNPYRDAAALCAELRAHGSMTLTTFGMVAPDTAHPLLAPGVADQLRVVHDVFGHAALGIGFDLQSEFATWLQCRTLFSDAARPAAFCETVGAVTAYITTGELPRLHADLPPAALLAACDVR